MNAVMAERIRLIIDTDDTIRRAVQLRRLKMASGTTSSDVVNGILRDALAEEIKQVASYADKSEEATEEKPAGKGKRKGK